MQHQDNQTAHTHAFTTDAYLTSYFLNPVAIFKCSWLVISSFFFSHLTTPNNCQQLLSPLCLSHLTIPGNFYSFASNPWRFWLLCETPLRPHSIAFLGSLSTLQLAFQLFTPSFIDRPDLNHIFNKSTIPCVASAFVLTSLARVLCLALLISNASSKLPETTAAASKLGTKSNCLCRGFRASFYSQHLSLLCSSRCSSNFKPKYCTRISGNLTKTFPSSAVRDSLANAHIIYLSSYDLLEQPT